MPRPPIEGGRFGYGSLNVEDQREQTGSLLNWMERLIRTRREWPEIGWGELRLLRTGDDAVLAHALDWMDGQVVAVHNMAGRRAPVRIALPRRADGGEWRHLVGPSARRRPPVVEDNALEMVLRPYEYHWFGRRERP
jgi:maltose alpha-D-glucosyltransferase/alpha-amylase